MKWCTKFLTLKYQRIFKFFSRMFFLANLQLYNTRKYMIVEIINKNFSLEILPPLFWISSFFCWVYIYMALINCLPHIQQNETVAYRRSYHSEVLLRTKYWLGMLLPTHCGLLEPTTAQEVAFPLKRWILMSSTSLGCLSCFLKEKKNYSKQTIFAWFEMSGEDV